MKRRIMFLIWDFNQYPIQVSDSKSIMAKMYYVLIVSVCVRVSIAIVWFLFTAKEELWGGMWSAFTCVFCRINIPLHHKLICWAIPSTLGLYRCYHCFGCVLFTPCAAMVASVFGNTPFSKHFSSSGVHILNVWIQANLIRMLSIFSF